MSLPVPKCPLANQADVVQRILAHLVNIDSLSPPNFIAESNPLLAKRSRPKKRTVCTDTRISETGTLSAAALLWAVKRHVSVLEGELGEVGTDEV